MSISHVRTGDRLNERMLWALGRAGLPDPAPRPPFLVAAARATADHAGNIAALLAGAAVLTVAAPFAGIMALAAMGAGVIRWSRERRGGPLRSIILPASRPPPALPGPRTARRRQAAASDHLYFSVRACAVQQDSHIYQVAFVDDRGNVVFSAFCRAAGPAPGLVLEPLEDMAAEPMDQQALEGLLRRLCSGAVLVGYGRVLQTGLLPAEVLAEADQVDCCWRRFLRVTRRQGLPLDRSQPLTLSDALVMAGLPPLESADAAMRALAIRELWTWLDRFEQDVSAGLASPHPRTGG